MAARRGLLALALAGAATLAALPGCGGDGRAGAPLAVMTRNLYLGAPLDPLFAPAAAADLPAAVAALWATVQASDPPARMARVADEIAAARPDLVGLQEAALFQTSPAPAGAETTAYDFAALVLQALRDRGLSYRAVSTSTNFSQQLPAGASLLLRFTDRDVLLARDGVATSDPRDGRYAARLSLTVAGVPLVVPRGWCSAVADAGGGPVRVWNGHLEAASRTVQEAQAQEVVELLAPEAARLVVLGDMNSPADGSESRSYAILRGAGLADAWTATQGAAPGLTCCFDPLLRSGALVSRIDLVLTRGGVGAASAAVVGAAEGDRTASGLWPSDHAGVSAALVVR